MPEHKPPARGAVISTVVLSPPHGDQVVTWSDQGERTVWTVDRPADYAATVGRGRTARTPVGDDRFRECGLIDRHGRTLLVPSRFGDPAAGIGARPFSLSQPAAASASAGFPSAFREWLAAVLTAALERGEFVVVERGGWGFDPEPYALNVCERGSSGWISHVEANPYPAGSQIWPPQPPHEVGSTLTSPLGEGSLEAAAALMLEAISRWATSPLDLGVTFGRIPDPEPPQANSLS